MTTMIENLRANGIDNPGITNALTSKLSAAQMAIGGGPIQTAVNISRAFQQSSPSTSRQTYCRLVHHCLLPLPAGTSFVGAMRLTPASVALAPPAPLSTEVQGIITSLKASVAAADPKTGSSPPTWCRVATSEWIVRKWVSGRRARSLSLLRLLCGFLREAEGLHGNGQWLLTRCRLLAVRWRGGTGP